MVIKRALIHLAFGAALLAPGFALAGPNPCTVNIAEAERTLGIPDGLMQAISVTESGFNGKPYPWALKLGGRVGYASNLDAAKKILGDRSAKGKKNLYAGCMQLSVKYHGNAFASLGDLLQPQRNVAYAAKYLASHHEDLGDWEAAVRRYHGGKPRQSVAYFCRVWRTLAEIKPQTARLLDNRRCGRVPENDLDDSEDAVELEALVPVPATLTREDRRELNG